MNLKASAARLLGQLRNDIKNTSAGLNPATSFLKLAVLFGLLLCFLTPPFQAPDEVDHYLRAYDVSQGGFLARKVDAGYGGNLPKAVGELSSKLNVTALRFYPDKKYHLWWSKAALFSPLNSGDKVPTRYYEAATYSAVAYVPQSLGVLLGRLLGLSALAGLYLGRLANLGAFVALVYFAIKLTPFGKWGFFVLGLSPMPLFLAASLSPDASLNAVMFLLGASVLHFIYEKTHVTKTDLVLLLCGFIFIALSKLVYLPIIVLLLLVPDLKFEGILPTSPRKTKLLIIASIAVISGLSGLFWNRLISPIVTAQLWVDNHVAHSNFAPNTQLAYILLHPFSYLVILLNTFFTNNANGILQSYLGILGWLDAMLPLWVMFLIAGLIIFILLSEKTHHHISSVVKWSLAGMAVFLTIAVSSALYVYSTALEYGTIIGIQGRYFIPIAALLIPVCANCVTWFRPPENVRKGAAFFIMTLVLMATVLVVLFRYYSLDA